jgi:hypothetical protein
MADRTVARRVKRYRALQKSERGIARVEVQVPIEATNDVKLVGRKLQEAYRRAGAAERKVETVLATINAPRLQPIDANELVHCLTTSRPERRWRPHIEALFDEVAPEAIHDLVLAGIVTFEDLYRAARTWRATHGSNVPWIREMADLRLARAAA